MLLGVTGNIDMMEKSENYLVPIEFMSFHLLFMSFPSSIHVIPAKAGIHFQKYTGNRLDSHLRGNDNMGGIQRKSADVPAQ